MFSHILHIFFIFVAVIIINYYLIIIFILAIFSGREEAAVTTCSKICRIVYTNIVFMVLDQTPIFDLILQQSVITETIDLFFYLFLFLFADKLILIISCETFAIFLERFEIVFEFFFERNPFLKFLDILLSSFDSLLLIKHVKLISKSLRCHQLDPSILLIITHRL